MRKKYFYCLQDNETDTYMIGTAHVTEYKRMMHGDASALSNKTDTDTSGVIT